MQGLTLIPNIISSSQEQKLIESIDKHPWSDALHRKVMQFGYEYDYKKKQVQVSTPLEPLPSWAISLCESLLEKKLIEKIPNQLIVNQYLKGQGISKHTDHPRFGPVIFSVSLGSPCKMIFRNFSKSEEYCVSPRTFLKMEREARHKWTHEIPALEPKDARRISLTFRYV